MVPHNFQTYSTFVLLNLCATQLTLNYVKSTMGNLPPLGTSQLWERKPFRIIHWTNVFYQLLHTHTHTPHFTHTHYPLITLFIFSDQVSSSPTTNTYYPPLKYHLNGQKHQIGFWVKSNGIPFSPCSCKSTIKGF